MRSNTTPDGKGQSEPMCAPCQGLMQLGGAAHAQLQRVAAVVDLVSRRQHGRQGSDAHLCDQCGTRWDWSESNGWSPRDTNEHGA